MKQSIVQILVVVASISNEKSMCLYTFNFTLKTEVEKGFM